MNMKYDVAAKNVSLSLSQIGTFGEMNKERKHGTESEALNKTKKIHLNIRTE